MKKAEIEYERVRKEKEEEITLERQRLQAEKEAMQRELEETELNNVSTTSVMLQ